MMKLLTSRTISATKKNTDIENEKIDVHDVKLGYRKISNLLFLHITH